MSLVGEGSIRIGRIHVLCERVGVRVGVCTCDMERAVVTVCVFMLMHTCWCVPGVQLGGRCCCWHGQWMHLVRATGSVVGLAVFWGCVLHIIFKELVLLYVRFYVYVTLFYV